MVTIEHGTNYLTETETIKQQLLKVVFQAFGGHQIGFYLNNDNYGKVEGVGGAESAVQNYFFGRPSMMNFGLRLGYETINLDAMIQMEQVSILVYLQILAGLIYGSIMFQRF